MKKAVAYLRTSSAANVGQDKDSDKRQMAAITTFARANGYEIVDTYYDTAVSGADPVTDRGGFTEMLRRLATNGAKTIIVESPDRFARDLMVLLVGHDLLKAQGITLIPTTAPDYFAEDTPTAVLVRQVLAAIAQFEKASTVAKLAAARKRKRDFMQPEKQVAGGSSRTSAQQPVPVDLKAGPINAVQAKPASPSPNPTFDPLEAFLIWFLKQGSSIGWVPLHGAVRYIDGVTAVLWYRKGEFQIQQFIVPPDHIIPEHTHPNVDSFEVYGGGQIRFSKAGRFIIPEEDLTNPAEHGWAKRRGKIIRVLPNDLHGGVFGPSGGVFFSVQRWLNGVKPHCVSADYNGVVMGPEHKAGVVFGDAELKTNLSAMDAASQEPISGSTVKM